MFDSIDGAPVQVVRDVAPFDLDIRDMPGNSDEITAQALATMDLRHGPLFRATLYRCGPQEHLLAMTMHHIIADGWSFGILSREAQGTL